MSTAPLTLYRPFEDQPSRRAAALLAGEAPDRRRQSLWGEDGRQRSVHVRALHNLEQPGSERLFLLAQAEAVILEVHHNPALYGELLLALQGARQERVFTRASLARWVIEQGFQLALTGEG
jgi:hypothetical protein